MSQDYLNPLFLFPVILLFAILYYLIPQKIRWIILLCGSYGFYFFIGKWSIFILFFSTLFNYFIGIYLSKSDVKYKKSVGIAGIGLNILLLVFSKYLIGYFSPDSLLTNLFTSSEGKILIPVGLSFYTLQNISYLVDIQKKLIDAERNLGFFAVYIAYFPKIVSGPIERAKNLIPQIHKPSPFSKKNIGDGVSLIVIGLFKKLVIADRLSLFVDVVFKKGSHYQGVTLIVALIFLSFQIYLDFSGYTNIAIGISKILGIRLTENFNRPYLSGNFVDFWGRWHISFSTWLRDYLFYPIRRFLLKKKISGFNLAALVIPPIITMGISGLWHGTGLTFLVWGLFHAFFYTLTIVIKNRPQKQSTKPKFVSKVIGILINFGILTVGWLIFRSESMSQAVEIFRNIFVKSTTLEVIFRSTYYADYLLGVIFIVIIIMSEIIVEVFPEKMKYDKIPFWARYGILAFLVLCITTIGVFSIGGSTFLYGNF